MKDFIRLRLLEAIKSNHWKKKYEIRVENSTFKDLGEEAKAEVDNRIKLIESLEFDKSGSQKIGIWLYDANKMILYPPFDKNDKGRYLLAIINNNNMTTLYWKHIFEGQYDYDITYDELVEFSGCQLIKNKWLCESEYYDKETKPVSIKNLKVWKNSNKGDEPTPAPNVNKFKKIKLSDGTTVKYYELLNKFETLEGQPISVDDILDKLPEDLQNKVIELLENRK
jgi:hypothetical protein